MPACGWARKCSWHRGGSTAGASASSQSRLGRSRLRPHRRSAGWRRRRDARRDLRAAARLPVRRAGQHDRDAARRRTAGARVPVYSLYSETREPTAEMLRGLDALVIDLQDIGARIYTYIYTMANCLRAARAARRARSSSATGRIRSAASTSRAPMLVAGLRVVRRPVPDPDAPRHDDRRARAAVQRALRHRRDARGRRDGGLASRACTSTRPALPWVMPSPNMPTLDTRDRLSGHGAVRRHDALGRRAARRRPFELVGAPWVERGAFRRRG